MIKVTSNKWNIIFGLAKTHYDLSRETRLTFHFGIFKLKGNKIEGMPVKKENYYGFWIQKNLGDFGFGVALPF